MALSPAEYVIHIFGGVRKAARAIGRSPSSISKWQRPRDARGCGGQIPSGARRLILEVARKRGLDITSTDLDFGRKVPRSSLVR